MKYILGIDQGGSKTHAIVSDERGRILGMGESYGACHSSEGLAYAVKAILEASDRALAHAGLRRENITATVGGLTGIDWDYEAELLEAELQKYFPRAKNTVVNDCIIAMRAATGKSRCGILCAGSGLNCAVQNGQESFAYGFYIPDEYQGGGSLGKRAVQAVFDSHMGLLPDTSLTKRLLDFFQTKSVGDLLFLRVKEKISSREYLRLPLILEEEALAGDRVAGEIWKHFGRTIAGYLTARLQKMGIAEEPVDVVLSGSIFKCRFRQFQETVKEEILRLAPKADIVEAEYEPVMGAIVLGLRQLHGELPEEVSRAMKETSRKFPLRRLPDGGGAA